MINDLSSTPAPDPIPVPGLTPLSNIPPAAIMLAENRASFNISPMFSSHTTSGGSGQWRVVFLGKTALNGCVDRVGWEGGLREGGKVEIGWVARLRVAWVCEWGGLNRWK